MHECICEAIKYIATSMSVSHVQSSHSRELDINPSVGIVKCKALRLLLDFVLSQLMQSQ